MTRNILVTGGAGYVGSHACKVLAQSGFLPIAFDSLVRGHRRAVQWGPLVEADLADSAAIGDVLRENRVEAVVHFADYARVEESVAEPGKYFRNNVSNSLNLVEAMVETGIRRIVFSSSCSIYGAPERVPIPEDAPQAPTSPYGETKQIVERILHWFGAAHGLEWVALRYFNAAGADADGDIGEAHEPETHLIPLAIETALGRHPHLEVFGADYATPDGTPVRDFVHVTDLARAHIAALEYLAQGGAPAAINLGTGTGRSVREVIRAVQQESGNELPVIEGKRRDGDVPILLADASKAAACLGWTPRHSSLENIVATAWRWHRKHDGDWSDSLLSG